jgi:hypothetical protein
MPAERLIAPERGVFPVPDSWTRDDVLFFQKTQTASDNPDRISITNEATLWTYSVKDKKAAPFEGVRTVTSIAPISANVSHDSRFVAYTVAPQSARTALQIFVRPLAGHGNPYLVTAGSVDPIWTPDGMMLFFNSLVDRGAFSAAIITQPHLEVGNPMPLPLPLTNIFRRSRSGPGTPRNVDITPDGQHFVAAVRSEGPDAGRPQIEVVLNWLEELKTRVPSN